MISPRNVGRGATVGAVAMLACCGALAQAPRSQGAEELRVIASSADWQVVMMDDPFADPPQQCQVRTRTANSGGRRERPLIIFDVTSQRITVRPDMALQGSITRGYFFFGSKSGG